MVLKNFKNNGNIAKNGKVDSEIWHVKVMYEQKIFIFIILLRLERYPMMFWSILDAVLLMDTLDTTTISMDKSAYDKQYVSEECILVKNPHCFIDP